MISNELFDKQRRKQKIIIFLKSLLLIILCASLIYIIYVYLINPSTEEIFENDPVQVETPQKLNVCLESKLPLQLDEKLLNEKPWQYDQVESTNFIVYNEIQSDCEINIARNIRSDGKFVKLWENTYVAVTRFDSEINDISDYETNIESIIANQNVGEFKVIWSPTTEDYLKSKFSSVLGQIYINDEQIHAELLENKNIIAIIPFEQITPQYKVLPIGGNYPYRKDYNPNTYPLTDSVWIKGEEISAQQSLSQYLLEQLGEENFQPEEINDIIISGSSAIGSRSQQSVMDAESDNLFPIRGVSDILKNADIAHMSNESAFTDQCVQNATATYYCGSLEAFEMLTEAGIDVVGLSGDHILDYGRPAFEETLTSLYDANGIQYFGAGLNFQDSHTPAIFELDGKQIAFLGYNFIGPSNYFAKENLSGSAWADIYFGDGAQLRDDLDRVKAEADYIFVDMQFGTLFTHQHNAQQEIYAKAAIDAGADVVSGVHSNYVQGIEYYNGGIIFYGLGLFLLEDPSDTKAAEGVMVRHIFYEEKYLGFELITTKMEENLQLVVTDRSQRDSILGTIFNNSKLTTEIENEN